MPRSALKRQQPEPALPSKCWHSVSFHWNEHPGNIIPPNCYFLRVRTCATNALISSSDKPSAGFILILPSLSLIPSLIALKASSSFNSACSLASVRFLMASFWPILVSPLPSGPWHLAHRLSQFSFTSAAEADNSAAAEMASIERTVFFIRSYALCVVRFWSGLGSATNNHANEYGR